MAATPQALEQLSGTGRPGWLGVVGNFIRRRPLGALGAAIILVMVVLALSADFIAPCLEP